MENYGNKHRAVSEASGAAEEMIRQHNLHPTDRVWAYREISRQAGAAAAAQEGKNDERGVPERPQDQQETAISERMDGAR